MNLRQLKYFIGVVDAGNMTRAAETLHVAQTALSTQVRHLEEDLGVTLLVRHSRGIEPTEAGHLLYARGAALLKEVEQVRRDVGAIGGGGVETVRLGVTPALMLALGADLVERVRDSVPEVALSLVEAMSHVLVENLEAGDLDYALCYDVPDRPRLARTAFLQEHLVRVGPPGRAAGRTVALVDVLAEPLVMPEPADTVRQAVAKAARDLGLDLKVTYEVRSISAMKSLAMRGVAVSILPYSAVAEEVRAGTLTAEPVVMPPIVRTLYLVSSGQRPAFRCDMALTRAVRASLDRLLQMLGPLAHPLWVQTS
jgi:LysR family nitrogen assimilation transcriptional regulator